MSQQLNDFSLQYPNMRIGRFSIKAGEIIPLHLHLRQYGFVYIVKGKCRIKNFTILSANENQYTLQLTDQRTVHEGEHSMITPTVNAHLITAIEDTTFLDSFYPGNKEGMLSQYCSIIDENTEQTQITAKIIPTEQANLPMSLRKAITGPDIIE